MLGYVGPMDECAYRRRLALGQAVYCEGIESKPGTFGPAQHTAVPGTPKTWPRISMQCMHDNLPKMTSCITASECYKLSDRQCLAIRVKTALLLQVHFPFPAFGQEVLSEGFAEGMSAASG